MTMRIAVAGDAAAVRNIVNTTCVQLRAIPGGSYNAANCPDWTLTQTQAAIANPQTTFAVSASGATILGVLQARVIGANFDGEFYARTAEALMWAVLPDSTPALTRTRFRTVSKEMLASYYARARQQGCSWVWGRLSSVLPQLIDEMINNMAAARPRIVLDRTSEPGWLIFRGSPDDGDAGLAGVV